MVRVEAMDAGNIDRSIGNRGLGNARRARTAQTEEFAESFAATIVDGCFAQTSKRS